MSWRPDLDNLSQSFWKDLVNSAARGGLARLFAGVLLKGGEEFVG